MATAVVMVCYVVAVLSLNLFVARRLTEQADARIADRLSQGAKATPQALRSSPEATAGDADPDDAPILLWMGGAAGSSTALSPGSPTLPRLAWTGAPTTVRAGGTLFRVDAVRFGSGWLIAGESLAQLDRVRSALARSRDPVRDRAVVRRLRGIARRRPQGICPVGDRATAPGRVHGRCLPRIAHAGQCDRGRSRAFAEPAAVLR